MSNPYVLTSEDVKKSIPKYLNHYNFLHKIEPNQNMIIHEAPLGYNDLYSQDIPNTHLITPSVFGYKIINNKDFIELIKKYNTDKKDPMDDFNYKNLNQIAINLYNNICWNEGWKNYQILFNKNIFFLPSIKEFPHLYKICFKSVLDFIKELKVFHLAKHKINDIFISKDKNTIKFVINVALTRNIQGLYFVANIITYYNKKNNTITLGKAKFLGSGTTEGIILPKGKDNLVNENMGRPLNSIESHDYSLIPFRKATDMYWTNIYYYK
jgi:hypothetical protein